MCCICCVMCYVFVLVKSDGRVLARGSTRFSTVRLHFRLLLIKVRVKSVKLKKGMVVVVVVVVVVGSG